MSELTKRTIRIDDELWQALSDLAAEQQVNMAEVIRQACVKHLAANGKHVHSTQTALRGRRGLGRQSKKENEG